MILFGTFLIILVIVAFVLYLITWPTSDPISWLIVGTSLGIVLAIGIILVGESRKK